VAFVLDADDGKDSTNDDDNETPGMLHTALLLLIFCCTLSYFIMIILFMKHMLIGNCFSCLYECYQGHLPEASSAAKVADKIKLNKIH